MYAIMNHKLLDITWVFIHRHTECVGGYRNVVRQLVRACVCASVRPSRIICFLLNILGTSRHRTPNLVCSYLSWKRCLGLYVGHLDLLSWSQRSSLCIHHKNAFHSICGNKRIWDHQIFVCRYLSWKFCLGLYVGYFPTPPPLPPTWSV